MGGGETQFHWERLRDEGDSDILRERDLWGSLRVIFRGILSDIEIW